MRSYDRVVILNHIFDHPDARRFALASSWWSAERNRFFQDRSHRLIENKRSCPGTEPITNPFPKFTQAEGKWRGFSENGPSRAVHVKVQSDANGRALSQRKKRKGGGLRADASQAENI